MYLDKISEDEKLQTNTAIKIISKETTETQNPTNFSNIQIEKVENSRVEYMEIQGNIFASQEELEKECTNELKNYFSQYFGILKESFKNFKLSE